VIRPDLILTEKGYIIAEIDSVQAESPDWLLDQTYSTFDNEIIGAPDGMLMDFGLCFQTGGTSHFAKAATYRPEMEWIARD